MDRRRRKATEALKVGVKAGKEVMVVAALALGGDPNISVWDDGAQESRSMLTLAARLGHSHLVPHLLAAGLHVDGSGECHTPLHLAAHYGHDQVVKELLRDTPHLEARIDFGKTALRVAAEEGHQRCVRTLLSAGADPNARDHEDRTPLHLAALCNHSAIVEDLVTDDRCNLQALDINNDTALHYAAIGGGMETAQYLLEVGLNLNAKGSLGYTPIDQAKMEGHHLLLWWLMKQPQAVVETPRGKIEKDCWDYHEGDYWLMSKWIREEDLDAIIGSVPLLLDSHQQDDAGMTILHHAAQLGVTRVVRLLLEECKVYPHAVTWAGDTPGDLAQQKGHLQVLNILHRHQPQVITVQV
ncbi:Ankyrin-2-like 1 [Homarus americanus]|uniref:Ankyrin-2-like 1 n=1 Tax=Homarus americanus TaxID=6706 RepID=A0A8J5TKI0_HOMAM|nr:Ankyrin-2-like 1 [Homarus americanus]